MRPIRVVLIDDHAVVRAGLTALLRAEPGFEVVGSVRSGEEALLSCTQSRPNVVLLDIGLPGMGGLAGIAALRGLNEAPRIVVLSGDHDQKTMASAIRAGARGYVVKTDSFREVVEALRVVAADGSYFSQSLQQMLFGCIRGVVTPQNPLSQLRVREIEVLRLVAMGNTSKEVAVALRLQTETVRTYRKIIMRKLGATNLAQLAKIAFASGVVGSDGGPALQS